MSETEKIKLENASSFDITTDNMKYKLIISYNDRLICFEIEKSGQFPKQEYYLYLNMEQLSNKNRFFLQFESIQQIFETLKSMIENKNLSIIEEGNNMRMKITIPFPKNSFYIDIPSKEKNIREEMASISKYIVELDEKIKAGNEKIKLLEEKIDELMKFKKDCEIAKKEKIKIENRYFFNSNIIKYEDENMIINWFDKKPEKFSKLLDSKEKGDSIQTFYNLCKHMPRLIIFIKTLSGYRFGGFTSNPIPTNSYKNNNSNNYGYCQDKTAFVFSIDKKQKYNINDEKYATLYYYDDSYNGGQRYFQFGKRDIVIYDNYTMNSENYVGVGNFDNFNNEIIGKDNYFIVDSFEVYQIDYKNE